MTNNTIANVPRELLADLLGNDHDKRIMAERHLLAMLANDPSPAGVDGLEVVGTLRYFMDYQDSPHSAPGYITHQFNPASWDHAGEAAGEHKLCRLSDAHAIIDGLRGEVADLRSMLATVSKAGLRVRTERDQQAQRIGELEGLLREVAASLAWNAHGECRAIHDGPIMPSQMAIDAVKAALGGSL